MRSGVGLFIGDDREKEKVLACGTRLASPPRGIRQASRVVLILTWLLALPAALAWTEAPAAASVAAVQEAVDLAADADILRQRRIPLLLVFTRDDCVWCDRLRREFLGPLQDDPAAPVLIRQVAIDRDTPLTDWDGRPTTHRELARARGMRLAPTVAFLGPRGETLAEPIVGYPSADLYGGLLERGIETATASLHAAPR